MKRFLFAIIACAMLLSPIAVSAGDKPEPVQHPPVYKCHASSDYAWGIGFGPTRRRAASSALYHCARRTPQGEVCVLDWCRRIR
jgi:hypothetical protein